MVFGMKHIKIKARRHSENDCDFMDYSYDLELEVDGQPVDANNVRVIELSWDVKRDVPLVRLEVIPETFEIETDVPPESSEHLAFGSLLEAKPSLDDFAKAALASRLASSGFPATPAAREMYARESYDMAEAMLAESERRNAVPVEESERPPAALSRDGLPGQPA